MICPHGHDESMVERLATPEEVDAGCELGVAFDPCPECDRDECSDRCCGYRDHSPGPCACPEHDQTPLHPFGSPVTLLGVPDDDFDRQAETRQGPPT